MGRRFFLAFIFLGILGVAMFTVQAPAYNWSSPLSTQISVSPPPPPPEASDENLVMGVVRHVEPKKGLIILETHTDILVVQASKDVCEKLHEGDVVMATLTPDEDEEKVAI